MIDINLLDQTLFTSFIFNSLEEWIKIQPNFIEYFQTEWLTSRKGWYEGVRHLTLSTNNALKATNRVIKAENTPHIAYFLTTAPQLRAALNLRRNCA